jgi:nitrate/nitrite transporter NarK
VTFFEKWLTMALLCLSGSTIFWMPFLSEVYFVPMQNAFGFSKTQMGVLSSVFGLVSLLCYFPGGWLADRLSPRKLITIALTITAASGFVFATIPSFEVCLVLFGFWGMSTAFVFWSAMIKATRNWGGKDEQGRAFGALEGGRNFSDLATATIFLAIFAYRGSDDAALSEIIVIISMMTLILAISVWTIMKDSTATQEGTAGESLAPTVKEIVEVLKLPIVWLISIIIMTAYSGLWGAIYFTPYATEVYALGVVWGGAIGVGKYWLAAIAAIVAGFIADRVGAAKAVLGCFVLMTAGFLGFGLIPGAPDLVLFLIFNVAVVASAVYALRGIYFSLLEQGCIPIAVTGTATGIISVIGYTPDIFLPALAGVILDANPGAEGYQNLFLFVSALSFLGLIAAYFVYRRIQVGTVAWPEQQRQSQ